MEEMMMRMRAKQRDGNFVWWGGGVVRAKAGKQAEVRT